MNRIKKMILCGLASCMLAAVAAVNFPAAGIGVSSVQAASEIGLKKAKEIALERAGCKASEVTFTKAKKDREHGRVIYELEFYNKAAEFDYDIDAKTGEILKEEYEVLKPARKAADKKITKARAKATALNHAGLKESDTDYIRVKKDREDGITVFEVEFYAGDMEYSYEIHARTGEILHWEKEYDD